MFKRFFAKEEEEESVFETVDPVLEQRRKEKFSSPLIYNDDETEKEEKKIEVKKEPIKKVKVTESSYRMSEIISPISGVKKTFEPEVKVTKTTKKVVKKDNDELIPIISPFYGPAEYIDEPKESELVQKIKE